MSNNLNYHQLGSSVIYRYTTQPDLDLMCLGSPYQVSQDRKEEKKSIMLSWKKRKCLLTFWRQVEAGNLTVNAVFSFLKECSAAQRYHWNGQLFARVETWSWMIRTVWTWSAGYFSSFNKSSPPSLSLPVRVIVSYLCDEEDSCRALALNRCAGRTTQRPDVLIREEVLGWSPWNANPNQPSHTGMMSSV